jgi:hypothetical protein
MRSEELAAYELGYRVQPHDRLTFDVAAFYNVYDRLRNLEPGALRLQTGPAGPYFLLPTQVANNVYGETYGAEIAANWQATKSWRWHVNYSYLQMQLHRRPGSALAGMGGAHLSLFYPGAWTEMISSGQGLMAVALVIFARWDPVQCLWASLVFGGTQAVGPALQAVGISSGYYLWNAAPYILTLLVMVLTCSPRRTLIGAPGALGTGT